MEALIVGLFVAVLAVWIAQPVFRRTASQRVFDEEDAAMERILESKHSVYRSILDLELEHRLGKLGDDEYRQMRAQGEAEALRLIAESQLQEPGRSHDEILEEEIREARRRLRSKR